MGAACNIGVEKALLHLLSSKSVCLPRMFVWCNSSVKGRERALYEERTGAIKPHRCVGLVDLSAVRPVGAFRGVYRTQVRQKVPKRPMQSPLITCLLLEGIGFGSRIGAQKSDGFPAVSTLLKSAAGVDCIVDGAARLRMLIEHKERVIQLILPLGGVALVIVYGGPFAR